MRRPTNFGVEAEWLLSHLALPEPDSRQSAQVQSVLRLAENPKPLGFVDKGYPEFD